MVEFMLFDHWEVGDEFFFGNSLWLLVRKYKNHDSGLKKAYKIRGADSCQIPLVSDFCFYAGSKIKDCY